jgi:DNA-binding transcriptional regulator YhcF (GntR family)
VRAGVLSLEQRPRGAERPGSAPPGRDDDRRGSEERREALLAEWARWSAAWDGGGATPAVLRQRLLVALQLGRLKAGDRLPSIREAARASRLPKHAVSQAYDRLEGDGLVEKRARSGVYVAPQDRSGAAPLGETAEWLAEVLTEACEHRIRVPYLPELIQRWTASTKLRCCCIESNHDARAALAAEVTHQFGLEAIPIDAARLSDSVTRSEPRKLAPDLQQADILVTTAFHASEARAVAQALGRPLVVATASPDYVAAVEERLKRGPLTVVCVDPQFGERIRAMYGSDHRRIRVVLATDGEAVKGIGASEPVLLTRAAYEMVGTNPIRLLHPLSGTYCPEFAGQMSRAIVQLNLESKRG